MNMTPEMQEMMKAKMSHYLTDYWEKNATPEMKEKAKAEGKTIKGAMGWIKSIAERVAGEDGMRVIPDAMAYWCFMEYMEHEKEGATYKSPEEIERERIEAEAKAKKKAEELAKIKAKMEEMQKTSIFPVSEDDARKALAEERKAREMEYHKRNRAKVEAELKAEKEKAKELKERKKQAEKVEEKIIDTSLDLFAGL